MHKRHRGLHLIAIVSVLAALSAGPQVVRAQPGAGASAAPTTAFVVNSLGDAPDANLANPACATAGAVCTFRAAVQQASATAGADTITFSVTGIITLTDFTPLITDTLTIAGPGPALLTIDAAATGPVLWAFNPLTPLSLNVSGLRVTGGTFDEGGGVVFNGQQLVISNTVVTGNAADLGGGLYVFGAAQVINSTFSHNVAYGRGGGIDAHGALDLVGSTLQANAVNPSAELLSAQGVGAYSGGGLFISGELTMTNSLVLSNTVEAPPPAQASGASAASGVQPAAPSGPFGAGIFVYESSAAISNSVIAGNHGLGCLTCTLPPPLSANPAGAPVSTFFGYGGGMYVYSSGLYIEDSQVLDNAAQFGGGLYVDSSTVTLFRSLVAGNLAEHGGGFGFYNPFLAVNNSVVRDNRATTGDGGGLGGTSGNVQLNDSLVSHNQAGGNGGGLYIGNADLYIGLSQIEGNAAGQTSPVANAAVVEPQIVSDAGGGLSVYGSDTHIVNSAIISNTATLGGGIDNASQLSMLNSTISGNSADRDGGGLRMTMPPVAVAGGGPVVLPVADLLHVTLAGNLADADNNGSGNGGGLFVTAATTITLHSTLLGANVDNGGQAPECAGTVQSTGYNLVESTDGCALAPATGDQFGVVSGVLPLANNGGATLTNGLPFGSLAVDAADPDPNLCNPQDQRLLPRPFGLGCDIGALELQALLYLPLALR